MMHRFSQRSGGMVLLPFAAAMLYTAAAAKADLVGAQVTIGGYCCNSPTAPDLFTNELTGTVPVSFPVGSLISVTTLAVIPASFDITAGQITETAAVAARATSGNFNGVVYDFLGLRSPITNVTVDPLSTFIPVSVTFTGNSIDVNVAGQSGAAGSKYVLDVTTGGVPPPATTPEPSTLVLLGAGLVGLAGLGFRQRRSGTTE